jgi:phosphotriesterase-related protein
MAVITVNGPVDKEALGITLPHEHLFVDLSFTFKEPVDPALREYGSKDVSPVDLHLLKYDLGAIRSNLVLDNRDLAEKELGYFTRAGGGAIVEQSSFGAGRRETEIQEISRRTGLHLVVAGGFYVRESLPEAIVRADEEDLALRMIQEMQVGIGRSGIRPGIIGEIGISARIGEWDRKVLKAAARAQKETGRAISVHIQAVPTLKEFSGELNGLEALGILEKAKADLSRVIVCHTDARIDLSYLTNIISRGSYAELDHFGKDFYFTESGFLMDRDMDRVLAVRQLVEDGRAERVLISQDVCLRTDLVAYGGFGYGHILEHIVPMMKRSGIGAEAIHTIMVENPKRLLDVRADYV